MSHKKFALLGAVAALAIAATGAQAAVTITDVSVYTGNAATLTAYSFAPAAVVDFNALPADGAGLSSSPFVSGGVTFTGSGYIANGTKDFYYMAPAGDTSNYLAASGNAYTLNPRSTAATLSYQASKLGLYWGSIDSYNTITFTLGGVATGDVVTGTDLVNYSANDGLFFSSNGVNTNKSAYVDIATSGKFDGFILTSTQPNFEVDNIAIGGVPEASTWAMMLIGFGGIAFAATRRKKTSAAQAFA